MHFCRPRRKHVQSFKKTSLKLYEKLQSQGSHCLYIWGQKMTKFKKYKKYGKDYMKSTWTSSDYGENMCKFQKD